jgi:hypothetical protein
MSPWEKVFGFEPDAVIETGRKDLTASSDKRYVFCPLIPGKRASLLVHNRGERNEARGISDYNIEPLSERRRAENTAGS